LLLQKLKQKKKKVIESHKWCVQNWSTQPNRVTSDIFERLEQKWQILLFPQGKGESSVAMYLKIIDYEGERFRTKFKFIVPHPTDASKTISKEDIFGFTWNQDRGFLNLIPFSDLPSYLINDNLNFEIHLMSIPLPETFQWRISQWGTRTDRFASEPIPRLGQHWQILLFPLGTGTGRGEPGPAFYLKLLDYTGERFMSRYKFTLKHPTDSNLNVIREDIFGFNRFLDRGFSNFIPFSNLPPYLVDDTLTIELEIDIPY